jgi:hypothetical protein
MPYVFGVLAALFLGFTIVGAITGRIRMSACCTIADPSRDLRMRSAFEPPSSDEIGSDLRG